MATLIWSRREDAEPASPSHRVLQDRKVIYTLEKKEDATSRGTVAMTPEAALQRQIECYRTMTGQQRLQIALDLHEFACNVAREGIRRQFPEATDDEVEQRLRRRIELSRQ